MNNFVQSFSQIMGQAMNNPQQYVQQIMNKYPEFARQIQGQNPQSMAMEAMRSNGIDPNVLKNIPMPFNMKR